MSALSNLSQRDRRAVALLATAAIVILGYRYFFVTPADETIGGIDSVPLAERRLDSLRKISAALPAKEAALKQVETALSAREKTMIGATTAAQAGARLLEVARKIGTANGIDIRGGELPTAKSFGADYGEVYAAVSFNCHIDQFVNFFADLSREPDLLAPSELTVNAVQDPKAKNLAVRMVLSAIVPRKLVPEKKGYGL